MRMGNRSKKSSPQNGGEFNGHLPLVEFVKKTSPTFNKSKVWVQNSPCHIEECNGWNFLQSPLKTNSLKTLQQIQVTFPTPTDFHTSPIFPAKL